MALPTRPQRRRSLTAPWRAVATTRGNRDLQRVALAWLAVTAAAWTVKVTLAVVAYEAGGSRAVALTVLARNLVPALLGAPVGSLTERLPGRGSLLPAALLCALLAGISGASGDVVVATVAASVMGLGTLWFRSAQSVLLPGLVRSPLALTAGNVLVTSAEAAGVTLGPLLTALLLVVAGPREAFAAAALMFVVGLLLCLRLPGGRRTAQSAGRGRSRSTLRGQPGVLLLGVLVALTSAASGGLVVLLPSLGVDVLGAGEESVGLLTAAFGAGAVVGSVLMFGAAGSRRLGGLLVASVVLLWGVPLVGLGEASLLPAALLLLLLVGGGAVVLDVTSLTLLQRSLPAPLLGRAVGAARSAVNVGLLVGSLAAPALVALVGVGRAFQVLGLVLLLGAAAAVAPLRRLDRRVGAPERQVALLRGVPAFALLPTPELERIALTLARRELAPDEACAVQGEPGEHWFLVDSGRLRVLVDGVEVGHLDAGESFGEIALLTAGVRTATVEAVQPSVVWGLAGADFLAAVGSSEASHEAALTVVADRLERAAPAR